MKEGWLQFNLNDPEKILSKIMQWSIIAAIVAFLLVSTVALVMYGCGVEFSVNQQEVFLDAYKAIGLGFLVAMIGTVLPELLSATRYSFEYFKESRVAYSEAKTAIMYLPTAMAKLSYAEAIATITKAHVSLHLAQTYTKELKTHLKHDSDPPTWGERMFWELEALRITLADNAEHWDKNIQAKERLDLANQLLDAVKDEFKDRDPSQPMKEGEFHIDKTRGKKFKQKLHNLASAQRGNAHD